MSTLVGTPRLANTACHNEPMDTRKLTEAQDAYKAAVENAERAKEHRDQLFRQAKKEGVRQSEIARAAGLTRETVRRILRPEVAEAVREARKRAEKEKEA